MLLQVPHASVNHVPTLTGGKGHEGLRKFYSQSFIPAFPGQLFTLTIYPIQTHILPGYSALPLDATKPVLALLSDGVLLIP